MSEVPQGRFLSGRFFRQVICLFIGAALSLSPLRAGTTTADGTAMPDGKDSKSSAAAVTAPAEEEPKNWIELGVGGVITHGDSAQFEQEHHLPDSVYGGIQDFHYEQALTKELQLTVDGHAIWDINDYDVKIDLTQAKVGYLRAGYTEFRSWYDGNGGYFPVNGQFFTPPIPEMHIDRGEAWVELGLRLPDWPEITVRYSHLFREGEKDSIIWGDTALTGIPLNRNPSRKIAPAYRDIDETRDIFSLEANKTFGSTDVNLGMRYEHDDNDNKLQLERGAGQIATILAGPPVTIVGPNGTAAAERFITQAEQNKIDLFSGHGTFETRVSDNLWFTGAYSYTTLGDDISGTRIIGPNYNSTYTDPILTLQSNDHGVLALAGTSRVEDNVANLNLMWIPFKDLTALAGVRYTYENKDSDDVFLDTNTTANVAPFTPSNPKNGFHRAAVPTLRTARTAEDFNNFAERLELRYTGIKNWQFWAEGEWEEECGDVFENEVVGASDQGQLNKNTSLLAQKYTAGANWYPAERINLSAQYYYRVVSYDNDFDSELAVAPVPGAERNQRLLWQDWSTNDVNVRLTWRPKIPASLGTVSLVSRYDYMSTQISGQWAVSPTQSGTVPAPPTPASGTILDPENTALITSHMITESLTWSPLTRLYFHGDLSYVLNETDTPVSGRILNGNGAQATYKDATFQDFRNDYWTVTGGLGYLLDDKTDLRADYTYYRANDYVNNSPVALPYGMAAAEHTVSATASRQITKTMRLILKYSYFHYTDQTSGGHNSYEAHSLYSGLQVRF